MEKVMGKYCVLISVTNVDTKQSLRSLLEEIELKMIGRDLETAGTETWFNRYVLGIGGTAATILVGDSLQELDLGVIVGINQNVNGNVLVELARHQTTALRQMSFSPPESRDIIIARMKQLAAQDGCEKVWVLQPGDSTVTLDNAALLEKFLPL
jgi:hypothetical protein